MASSRGKNTKAPTPMEVALSLMPTLAPPSSSKSDDLLADFFSSPPSKPKAAAPKKQSTPLLPVIVQPQQKKETVALPQIVKPSSPTPPTKQKEALPVPTFFVPSISSWITSALQSTQQLFVIHGRWFAAKPIIDFLAPSAIIWRLSHVESWTRQNIINSWYRMVDAPQDNDNGPANQQFVVFSNIDHVFHLSHLSDDDKKHLDDTFVKMIKSCLKSKCIVTFERSDEPYLRSCSRHLEELLTKDSASLKTHHVSEESQLQYLTSNDVISLLPHMKRHLPFVQMLVQQGSNKLDKMLKRLLIPRQTSILTSMLNLDTMLCQVFASSDSSVDVVGNTSTHHLPSPTMMSPNMTISILLYPRHYKLDEEEYASFWQSVLCCYPFESILNQVLANVGLPPLHFGPTPAAAASTPLSPPIDFSNHVMVQFVIEQMICIADRVANRQDGRNPARSQALGQYFVRILAPLWYRVSNRISTSSNFNKYMYIQWQQ